MIGCNFTETSFFDNLLIVPNEVVVVQQLKCHQHGIPEESVRKHRFWTRRSTASSFGLREEKGTTRIERPFRGAVAVRHINGGDIRLRYDESAREVDGERWCDGEINWYFFSSGE